MDAVIINQFITKITNIFNTLYQQTPIPGDPYLLSSNDEHQWELGSADKVY